MKFLGKGCQQLEHEQDRQIVTDTHTQTPLLSVFAIDKKDVWPH